jgi:hypothetical protein
LLKAFADIFWGKKGTNVFPLKLEFFSHTLEVVALLMLKRLFQTGIGSVVPCGG